MSSRPSPVAKRGQGQPRRGRSDGSTAPACQPHRLKSHDENPKPRATPLKKPQRSPKPKNHAAERSEEHTSELQSLMRSSSAVFCLKHKTNRPKHTQPRQPSP